MKDAFLHWESRTCFYLLSVVNHCWRLKFFGAGGALLFLVACWRNILDYFSGEWKGLMISCATAFVISLDGLLMPFCILFFFSLTLRGFLTMHKPIDGPLLMQLINRSTACFLIPTHTIVSAITRSGELLYFQMWSAFWILDLFTWERYSDLNYSFQTMLQRKAACCCQHKEN